MSQINEFYLSNLLETLNQEHAFIMNKLKSGVDDSDFDKQLVAINGLMVATLKMKKMKKMK